MSSNIFLSLWGLNCVFEALAVLPFMVVNWLSVRLGNLVTYAQCNIFGTYILF